MSIMKQKKIDRNSSIELLKIISIVMIIIAHVVQSCEVCKILNTSIATTNIKHIILVIFRYGGMIGNTIFFTCSAYFLLDNKKINFRKWFRIIFEVWIISVLILLECALINKSIISAKEILRNIMPVIFRNNWYISCYILFYPIHIFLNLIINKLNKKQHLQLILPMIGIYLGICFLKEDLFFNSYLIIWIVIYFLVAYIKLYLKKTASNLKVNLFVLFCSLLGHIGIILITNKLGLNVKFFNNKLDYWRKINNPFIIFGVISLINIVINLKWKNIVINRISKLSLLIYILHENLLLRTYFRPRLLKRVYNIWGDGYIITEIILFSFAIFLLCTLVCWIYDITIRKYIWAISDRILCFLKKLYKAIEGKMIQID